MGIPELLRQYRTEGCLSQVLAYRAAEGENKGYFKTYPMVLCEYLIDCGHEGLQQISDRPFDWGRIGIDSAILNAAAILVGATVIIVRKAQLTGTLDITGWGNYLDNAASGTHFNWGLILEPNLILTQYQRDRLNECAVDDPTCGSFFEPRADSATGILLDRFQGCFDPPINNLLPHYRRMARMALEMDQLRLIEPGVLTQTEPSAAVKQMLGVAAARWQKIYDEAP